MVEERELTTEEIYGLTRAFVDSDFYKLVLEPKLVEAMAMARTNSFMATEPHLKCWWVEFEKAYWNIINVWIPSWLTPEDREVNDQPT